MLIYNITTKVENHIAEEWLQWQKEIYIPKILDTGLFYEYHIFKLLEQDETEGKTYVTQFYANNKEAYKKYIHHDYKILRSMSIEKWGNNYIDFESLLQTVK